jgi:hypothetical protein
LDLQLQIHIIAALTHIIASICRSAAEIQPFSAMNKTGEFLSQSVFRAKLCAGKINIGSAIQAQGTGEVMRRKWRIIESNYNSVQIHQFHSHISNLGETYTKDVSPRLIC